MNSLNSHLKHSRYEFLISHGRNEYETLVRGLKLIFISFYLYLHNYMFIYNSRLNHWLKKYIKTLVELIFKLIKIDNSIFLNQIYSFYHSTKYMKSRMISQINTNLIRFLIQSHITL